MFTIEKTTIHYLSKRLEKATQRVYKIADAINQNAFCIAWIIADTEDAFTADDNPDGFKNVIEWAMAAFGFKKSTAYNLLKIGKFYTAEVKTASKTTYRDNITAPDEIPFTISQIMQFLPYDYADVEKAYKEGVISPEMSCRALADTLKKWIKKTETDAETDETDAETDDSTDYAIVTDENGTQYRIPRKVLEDYAI